MTGVDRYGFEMSAMTPEGPRPIRLAFPQAAGTAEDVRGALVSMVAEARATLARH
jgi:putative heme iron utilization protein